jgi:hypothetical protein
MLVVGQHADADVVFVLEWGCIFLVVLVFLIDVGFDRRCLRQAVHQSGQQPVDEQLGGWWRPRPRVHRHLQLVRVRRDGEQVHASLHVPGRYRSESVAGLHESANEWHVHAARILPVIPAINPTPSYV